MAAPVKSNLIRILIRIFCSVKIELDRLYIPLNHHLVALDCHIQH
jgi:hypothetical protein